MIQLNDAEVSKIADVICPYCDTTGNLAVHDCAYTESGDISRQISCLTCKSEYIYIRRGSEVECFLID